MPLKFDSQNIFHCLQSYHSLSNRAKFQTMQQEGVMSFSVIWRGKKFVLEMNPSATLKDLGNELQKKTNVRTDTMRLIVSMHKNSKMLYPFAEEHSCLSLEAASILEGKSIRMMGVPQDEVDEVLRNAKVDHRIAGFDEEEKRMRKRMLKGQQLPQLPRGTYIFCDFQTLHIPGIELNPPASEALKLMHRLAADPGIVAIMNKHRWRVGIMTEMAPVGYVGVSPKCILGFNKNHGEEISLRLRTDDLRGFRKYERIKMTLLHELAHMIHSEHDENFHALDKQLNEEAAALDWSKSRSHTMSGVKYSQSNEEVLDIDSSASLPRKLGGQTIVFHNARASSVAAAYHRLASASVNLPEASAEEPDPDNGGFDEFDAAALEKKELNFVNIENPEKLNYVLKLDDQYYNKNANKSESEPDPDDSLGCESMKPEPHTESGESRITSEPDPDDCHSCESVKPEPPAESGQIGYTFEPDPDDSEITIPHLETELGKELEPDNWEVSSVHGTSVAQHASESMDVCSEGNTTSREPDSHEFQGIIIQPKADHDDMMHTMGKSGTELTDEPVLDDQELRRIQDSVSILCSRLQKAIEMLRSEVNPTGATMVLQTLLKIVRNIIERPDEVKFRRLRKANPVIQRNILDYRAAMEIISLIGFTEDVIFDEFGKAETYFVLKHNDPGRLWLAKSSLETPTA